MSWSWKTSFRETRRVAYRQFMPVRVASARGVYLRRREGRAREPQFGPKVSRKEYEAFLALYGHEMPYNLPRCKRKAAEYARETFTKAEAGLADAEHLYAQSPKNRMIVTLVRGRRRWQKTLA
jgi:hypothetical protein